MIINFINTWEDAYDYNIKEYKSFNAYIPEGHIIKEEIFIEHMIIKYPSIVLTSVDLYMITFKFDDLADEAFFLSCDLLNGTVV